MLRFLKVKLLFDLLQVIIITKRNMVDLMTNIDSVDFIFSEECVQGSHISMTGNVEVSWDL